MPRQYTPRAECICQNCGKPFGVKAYRAESARYCSATCRLDSPNARLICEGCGNPFEVIPTRASTARFCSQACRYGKIREDAFWKNMIAVGDCWIWQGKECDDFGYGRASFQGRRYQAHRLAYELTHGAIPDGLRACHTCDTPKCCNPAHIFLGTNTDNTADRTAKGRDARGERVGMARLTEGQVCEMRIRYAAGDGSYRTLAIDYGVTKATVRCIVLRRTWTHLVP